MTSSSGGGPSNKRLVGLIVDRGTSIPACGPPLRPHIPVPLFDQETNAWCWAACCQMLVKFHCGKKPAQGTIAEKWLSRGDPTVHGCDGNPVPGSCIRSMRYPQLSTELYRQWRLHAGDITGAGMATTAGGSIQSGTPLLLGLYLSRVRSHLVVAVGWKAGCVYYNDPDPTRRPGAPPACHDFDTLSRRGPAAPRRPPPWAWTVA